MDEAAVPASIGPFLVLRKLGEGGMGIVYAGYDVALDRKVALKLIRRALVRSNELRTRMIREAQAMARLSHPNVVQVYQVGQHDDEIYMAMEYVEGATLSAWLQAERRPWQVVLRTVIAAGRGLAAAHAAGLVHRDFKPDNVLVGSDGRPCVLDFGLVDAEGAALSQDAEIRASMSNPGLSEAALSRISTLPIGDQSGLYGSVRLTQIGKSLGTPAYMSPEQHFGEEVGPAADQFSFGITLYEALYGVRPFTGMTWGELKQQVRRGEVPPPPKDSKVPRRVFKIITRGLATNADMRWPTLASMLDALERDPRRTLMRVAVGSALALSVATGSYAAAMAQQGEVERCRSAGQLVGAWDETRAATAELAFAATGAAYSADTWQRVRGRLDNYAMGWTAEHTRACEAHVSGVESTGLFDLRTRCLARRKAHLAALVEVFAAADRSVLENAVQATAALPSVDSCGDAEALLAGAAPPDDAVTAAQVESWRGRLARAAALEGTGQYARGLELIAEVRAAAEGLRYPPLVAEVALVEGSLLMAVARDGDAEAALKEALRLGLVLGLDAVAAEAAAKRIFVIGYGQGRREAALEGEAVAEALAERAHDERVTALLHNNLGVVLAEADQADRARVHYLQSVELLRRQATKDPLIAAVHHNLGGLERDLKRLDEARDHYEQAARLFAELLGDKHPLVAHPLGGMAEVEALAGHDVAAAEGYTRALALMEAAYGADHIYLLHPLVGLGAVRARSGDGEAATRLFRRAVVMGEREGTTNPMYAEALAGLAGQLEASEPEAARALLGRAIVVLEADGDGPGLASLLVLAGRLAVKVGDFLKAKELIERVLVVTTGHEEYLKEHGAAALELARLLGGEEMVRACDLLVTAQAEVGEELRAEVEKLHASRCGSR